MNNQPINDAFVIQCPKCHWWNCGKTEQQTISCIKCKNRIKWKNLAPHAVPTITIAVEVCQKLNNKYHPVTDYGITTSASDVIRSKRKKAD